MDLSFKYSYIGKTMCLVVFYVPIIPICVPIAFIGIFLLYLVEKYNIISHYKRPQRINGNITKFYLMIFRLFIFIYSISNYIFLKDIYIHEPRWELIAIIIFGVLIIIPTSSIINFFGCLNTSGFNNEEYEKNYFEIGLTYAMSNPLTKYKAFENYLDKMLQNNIVNEEEYKRLLDKVKSDPSDIVEMYYKKKYEKNEDKKGLKLFKNIIKNQCANYDDINNNTQKRDTYLNRLKTKDLKGFKNAFNI